MRNYSIGNQVKQAAVNAAVGGAISTVQRLGPGNIGIFLLLVALFGAPLIPGTPFAAVLPFSVTVGALLMAKLWARVRHKTTVSRDDLAPYTAGIASLAGVALIITALRMAAPGLGALAAESWEGVRTALGWLPNIPFEMVLLTVAMGATGLAVAATALIGCAAGEADAKDEQLALTEDEVFLEDLAAVFDVDEKFMFEAAEVKTLLIVRKGEDVHLTVPQKLRKKLRELEWLDSQVALYMPDYEAADPSPRQGTLTLKRVSQEAEAQRMNLELNEGVTRDDVSFDFGDAGDEVENIDFSM